MKEVIISTEAVNCYGTRVLTSGIDLEQYKRNPVLLWMHRRSFEPGAMPIGRIENLRVEDGKLIGMPVFDQADDFAKKIESKWENGFLRMASAALEPLATSSDPALVADGQTRETVTRCKLIEVSIVDIGGNDEALQLYGGDKLLKLAAGEESPTLPLLTPTEPEPETKDEPEPPITKPTNKMTKEQLQLLGLPEDSSDEQISAALNLMKSKADSADTLQLAAVTKTVDQAIADRKIVAAQREHFINLGKAAGIEMLTDTIKAMPVQAKPTEVINLSNATNAVPAGGAAPKSYAKLGDVPESERLALRKDNPAEYMRLYKEEYGIDCPALNE
ncbi:MAG: phage protease [Lachnospiraceae bacterium]|nr:phage protease [Lachnospiraceae bacterium]